MENLNAENIKRGLACCKGSYDCFTCDIYKRGCAGWREGLAKDALALINSQEQDKEKLCLLIDEIAKEKRELFEENKRLTEVVERSETAGGCKESVDNGFSPSVTELQRENERLRADNEIKSQKRANIFEIANAFERGRTDGVRKMRLLIKRRSKMCEKMENGIVTSRIYHLTEEDLDQIAKEMLEENK